MSIVVYRSGVIAGDCAQFADYHIRAVAPKVVRAKRGHLFGAVGPCWETKAFLELAASGGMVDPMDLEFIFNDDATGLMAAPDGDIYLFEKSGRFKIDSDYIAIGAGAECAFGALDAGADAIEAVRIAIGRVKGCGYPVSAYTHGGSAWSISQARDCLHSMRLP